MKQEIFLGNGAIALGLMEAGCQVMTSYPGTPSSEILPEAIRLVKAEAVPERIPVEVTDDCTECNFCHDRFECPALYKDEGLGRTRVNQALCVQCGVCLQVCPTGAIVRIAD